MITFGIYAQGYSFFVGFASLPNEQIILAKYKASNIFPVDTIQLNSSGEGIFAGAHNLIGGLYIIVHQNAPVVEFLLGEEQNLRFLQSNTGINIEGSSESSQFMEYQTLLRSAGRYKNKLLKQVPKASEIEKIAISNQLDSLDKVIESFIYKDIEQFKGSLYADFLNASKPFKYPKNLSTENLDHEMITKRYFYQRDHFLEAINFQNSALLNTPVLKSKLDHYFNKVLIQHPDTIIPQALKVLSQSNIDSIMFQFLSSYFLNLSQDSKLMGMDKLLVKVADFSYLSGRAYWASNSFLRELQIKVRMLRANLIGNTAPEIRLPNVENNEVALKSTDAIFTLLVFWEIDCGHCQEEIPKLHTQILESSFANKVKVYAVHTDNKYDQWVDYIAENSLEDWINVYNKQNETNFKIDYNVIQTPMIYVLDGQKKIVAKNLNVDQTMHFIDHSSKY